MLVAERGNCCPFTMFDSFCARLLAYGSGRHTRSGFPWVERPIAYVRGEIFIALFGWLLKHSIKLYLGE
jgi:hypothetical protein